MSATLLSLPQTTSKKASPYVGIDGEGKGRNPHRYTMICLADEHGEWKRSIENPEGLNTYQCLLFLSSLHKYTSRAFSYAFNYDLTKMLEDLPDEALYLLARPDLRANEHNTFVPIRWKGFKLHLNSTRFSVRYGTGPEFVIWDLFKFFQSKFVGAIKDWEVGTPEDWDRIAEMKDKRHEFEHESVDQVRAYCFDECMFMGQLAHKLVDAHKRAGFSLTEFYGAGSTASLFLENIGIKDKRREPSEEMLYAVMCSFAGGRFENSRIGRIKGPVHSWDIASAYPYQISRLPCLEHATWEVTTSLADVMNAKQALVMWQLGPHPCPDKAAWGPFPFRTSKGAILFPVEGGTGFVWREEFLAGYHAFPNVKMVMAYVYKSDCDCKPFEEFPKFYRKRCELGKDAAGKVFKLGTNAGYGKLAQSVGNPKYNCWIWAAIITSNTRAQLLRAIALHKNYSDVCIIATDGLYATEFVDLRNLMLPDDTGTNDVFNKGKITPLGCWEYNVVEDGMFSARPGINFPLDLFREARDEEERKKKMEKVRARGFGRKAVFDNAKLIMDSYEKHGMSQVVQLPGISRFYGMKTSIHRRGPEGAYEYVRAPEYGSWYLYEPNMSFDPMPKRTGIREDGSLICHSIAYDLRSSPYKPELYDLDSDNALRFLEEIMEEQDD